jgi:hypothetical protein
MKTIEHGGEVYAVIVGPEDFVPGGNFVSEKGWGLQVGAMMYAGGHTIQPHRHNLQPSRVTPDTQEFLFVIAGTMEVSLFASEEKPFHTEELSAGHGILQVKGGHAFRFSESSRVIIVKQGPYFAREVDKTLMTTANSPAQETGT